MCDSCVCVLRVVTVVEMVVEFLSEAKVAKLFKLVTVVTGCRDNEQITAFFFFLTKNGF